MLRGDLGTDVISGRPILTWCWRCCPTRVTLTFSAMGLAVLIGVPLGCYAATHPNTLGDRIAAVLSVSFIAMPSFVVAIYLLLIFSIWLHWLPVLGTGIRRSFLRPARAAGAAGRVAGARLDRLHRAAGALLAARGAGRALHPHEPRLRHLRAPRSSTNMR